ncbi:MAG: hypothetical protein M3R03_01065 [Pseudomonadota bacterium]|nr:hypothetical protein [Pseudomonadota bacterium]
MRKILTVTALLLLAGCGTTPTPTPSASPVQVVAPERGDLLGLDANALATRFGAPRLQVREGSGTKLQFAGGSCLLDAYLYPSPSQPRVTHIDTRNREGQPVLQAECIRMIQGR